MEIACCLALHDQLAEHYLTPLVNHQLIDRLWLIRHKPLPNLNEQIVKHISVSEQKPLRFIDTHRALRRLTKRPKLRAIISFNPFPYGIIPLSASNGTDKAVHFGFIGSDWYRDAEGPLMPMLIPLIMRADYLTATGEAMKQRMIYSGIAASKIGILPHTVDTRVFTENNPDQTDFDMIYVGQLIQRKKVDVIVKGFAGLKSNKPDAKLCIVGDGPLRNDLQLLAQELNIETSITFTGYRTDVAAFLSRSKIIVIASNREGFPFALIEGMCSGLVPIATPVGTIPDLIEDGTNGCIIPLDSAKALTESASQLLLNYDIFTKMRNKALKTSATFDYKFSTDMWDSWLKSLESESRRNLI